jgi:hypothetical protein
VATDVNDEFTRTQLQQGLTGILITPITGTVEVTDQDVIVDADLGLLNRPVPEKAAREVIGNRIMGLLK